MAFRRRRTSRSRRRVSRGRRSYGRKRRGTRALKIGWRM